MSTNLFTRFESTKEKGFREEFIAPLLVKMGFIGVTEKHGGREFGKDFVFSELDRFGHMRHMAVQAKHIDNIRQGSNVEDLLSQVNQAFEMPFTLPTSPKESRWISALYIFNSGSITAPAEEQIVGKLNRELTTNTHVFDGNRLQRLYATVAFHQHTDVRNRLVALLRQMKLNVDIWENILRQLREESIPRKYDLDWRAAITAGMEQFLTAPLTDVPYDVVERLWGRAKLIIMLVEKHTFRSVDVSVQADEMRLMHDVCRDAISDADQIIAAIQTGLWNLALVDLEPIREPSRFVERRWRTEDAGSPGNWRPSFPSG